MQFSGIRNSIPGIKTTQHSSVGCKSWKADDELSDGKPPRFDFNLSWENILEKQKILINIHFILRVICYPQLQNLNNTFI